MSLNLFLALIEKLNKFSRGIMERIEELRDKWTSKVMNQRAKYDKAAKSKDIIIMTKDKKI